MYNVILPHYQKLCVYAYMIKVFVVIISGWWDYGDNYYFLSAGLNFLQPGHSGFS